ncbi:MAG: domain containing protein [Deltaproteobacteria bacterium]|nr:domain containing protein [Deltaproteobacteria bacterium]
MKIISINVGLPREIFHEDRIIRTGIFKAPVGGKVRVNALNLAGDQQADLTVHGGPSKAVYVYPTEHYDFWRKELPDVEFPWGSFGENLSTEGLLEKELNVGDRLCVGSVELAVTEPRLPCYKLGVKFNRGDMVRRFLKSRRTGFYCAVISEGEIAAGDPIQFLSRDEDRVTIADITRLYAFEKQDLAGLRRAADLKALPESWRDYFRERVGKLTVGSGT